MHVAISPVLLGHGERLFAFDDAPANYRCIGFEASPYAMHARFARLEVRRDGPGVGDAVPPRKGDQTTTCS